MAIDKLAVPKQSEKKEQPKRQKKNGVQADYIIYKKIDNVVRIEELPLLRVVELARKTVLRTLLPSPSYYFQPLPRRVTRRRREVPTARLARKR